VTVQIDFDGLQQRIVAVPGIAERPYSDLQTGVDGQVFFLESRPTDSHGRAGRKRTSAAYARMG
jgi:tricorn protease